MSHLHHLYGLIFALFLYFLQLHPYMSSVFIHKNILPYCRQKAHEFHYYDKVVPFKRRFKALKSLTTNRRKLEKFLISATSRVTTKSRRIAIVHGTTCRTQQVMCDKITSCIEWLRQAEQAMGDGLHVSSVYGIHLRKTFATMNWNSFLL